MTELQTTPSLDDVGMSQRISMLVDTALSTAQSNGDLPSFEHDDLGIEKTTDASKGDWTSTVALRCAKAAHMSPRDIAQILCTYIQDDEIISSVEVAGPGFLNFWLTAYARTGVFGQVCAQADAFGRSDAGLGKKINVEYVSANPVGPMHVGHGRWAALGDSLCRILEFCGWDVTREFYINDAGNQMDVFARSIDKRFLQICDLVKDGHTADEAVEIIERDRIALLEDDENVCPESHPLSNDFVQELGSDSYGGAYIIDIARLFFKDDGISALELDANERLLDFRERGYALMLAQIQSVLHSCDCDFDVWFSERTLHDTAADGSTCVTRAFDALDAQGRLYNKDGARWFASSALGDDKDRVLIKNDGSYTYFSSDIAYHADKFNRGFHRCIDVWGADHHGYVPRMKAAVAALGHEGELDILLGQLVNLLRDGEPVRMSKRKGTMVTFEELLDEVGSDAARFTLLSRSNDQEIDFDIAKVKRESSDNPVYYVQYAHARICSILCKAAGVVVSNTTDIDDVAARLVGANPHYELLSEATELALARQISAFGELILGAARDLAPYRLTYYAIDLASAFHGFYTACRVLTDDAELTRARLGACDATRRVLAQTLGLMGVSAPIHMAHREEEGNS